MPGNKGISTIQASKNAGRWKSLFVIAKNGIAAAEKYIPVLCGKNSDLAGM